MPTQTQAERLAMLMSDGAIWRMRDLRSEGVNPATVRAALDAGTIDQISRGTYRLAGAPEVEGAAFAEVCARIQGGIVCLLSAADFHGLSKVPATEVWISLPHGHAVPRIEHPPLRVIRYRKPWALTVGVEKHEIQGVPVPITSAARTVIDVMEHKAELGPDLVLQICFSYIAEGYAAREVSTLARKIGLEKKHSIYLDVLRYLEANHERPRRRHTRSTSRKS